MSGMWLFIAGMQMSTLLWDVITLICNLHLFIHPFILKVEWSIHLCVLIMPNPHAKCHLYPLTNLLWSICAHCSVCVCVCVIYSMSEVSSVPISIVKPKISYSVESSQQSTWEKQINKHSQYSLNENVQYNCRKVSMGLKGCKI